MSDESGSGHAPGASDAFGAARQRRVELKQAMSDLEVAAASAAADPAWIEAVGAALDQMRDAFDAHVEEVEAPDGLLGELVAAAPRLSPKVERLRDEHPALSRRIDACQALLDEADHGKIRSEVVDLLFALVHHRQVGSDLVFEAYNVDIGGP